MNRRLLLAIPCAAAAALAGCGSSSSSSSSAPAASSASTSPAAGAPAATAVQSGAVAVSIKDLAYKPATLHVKVGTTITWKNIDNPPHNVMPQSGPPFKASPQVLNPGQSYSVKFSQAGTVTYFCSIHPFMHGTVVVSS